jgi:hypothetical protein
MRRNSAAQSRTAGRVAADGSKCGLKLDRAVCWGLIHEEDRAKDFPEVKSGREFKVSDQPVGASFVEFGSTFARAHS